jgi:hypothetical protein
MGNVLLQQHIRKQQTFVRNVIIEGAPMKNGGERGR